MSAPASKDLLKMADVSSVASLADDDGDDLPVFRTCKFCQRSSRTPNPLSSYVPGKFIKWRRAKGRECASCPWFIQSDALYADQTCGDLETKLQEKSYHQTYMEKLQAWEVTKNGSKGQRIISGRPKAHRTVVASQSDMFKAEADLGWLWPVNVWEALHGGQKLEKRRIRTFRAHSRRPQDQC